MTTENCVDCRTELQENKVVWTRRRKEDGTFGPLPMCTRCWKIFVDDPERAPHMVKPDPEEEQEGPPKLVTVGSLRKALLKLDSSQPVALMHDGTIYNVDEKMIKMEMNGRTIVQVIVASDRTNLVDLMSFRNAASED